MSKASKASLKVVKAKNFANEQEISYKKPENETKQYSKKKKKL